MMALAIAIIMSAYKTTKMELETEAGVQKIQGFSVQLIQACKDRYDLYFAKKTTSNLSMYQEYGNMLIQALLRSDADGNFEIDEEELYTWIRSCVIHVFHLFSCTLLELHVDNPEPILC